MRFSWNDFCVHARLLFARWQLLAVRAAAYYSTTLCSLRLVGWRLS